jgi:hypothetical protein
VSLLDFLRDLLRGGEAPPPRPMMPPARPEPPGGADPDLRAALEAFARRGDMTSFSYKKTTSVDHYVQRCPACAQLNRYPVTAARPRCGRCKSPLKI